MWCYGHYFFAVADEILDGPRSRVIQEAANRLVVQMAVLYRLLKG